MLDCNVLKGSAPNRIFGGVAGAGGVEVVWKKNFGIDLRVNRRYSHAGRFITYMCHLQDTYSWNNHQTTYVNLGFLSHRPLTEIHGLQMCPKTVVPKKEQEYG